MNTQRFLRYLLRFAVVAGLVTCLTIFVMALNAQYGEPIRAQATATKHFFNKLIGRETKAEKAAQQLVKSEGIDNAQLELKLAMQYTDEKNFDKAIPLLTKLSTAGWGTAQRILGNLYVKGNGVQQETQRGVFWLTHAAERGDGIAQFELGRLYLGEALPNSPKADIPLALRWIQAAASNQDMVVAGVAQDAMATLLIDGRFVPKDLNAAMAWAKKAKVSGYAGAEETIQQIQKIQSSKRGTK
jgi:uncharacterized protein